MQRRPTPSMLRRVGMRNAIIGGLILAVGIVVTVLSYIYASSNDRRLWLAWGATTLGGTQLAHGLSQLKQR